MHLRAHLRVFVHTHMCSLHVGILPCAHVAIHEWGTCRYAHVGMHTCAFFIVSACPWVWDSAVLGVLGWECL